MSRAMAGTGYRVRAARFDEPMVSTEFGYSSLGAAAAAMLACVLAAALYAFTRWPLETAGWLAFGALARALGRYPAAAFMR